MPAFTSQIGKRPLGRSGLIYRLIRRLIWQIEVDITSLTDLEIYQILAIPEVWGYRQGQLSIYVLTANGYEDRSNSPTFPTVDVKNLLPEYVERAWSAGSSVALREFEQVLNSD